MHHLIIDGIRLECRRIAGAEPTLVFLHEGLGSVSLWRDFPDRVAAATGLAALVYSRQGYGGSSPVPVPRPLDYMQREGTDGVPRVLDALGLERVILIGHSDGASIALVNAALDRTERVAGLVVMAPHSFVEDMCTAAIAEARTAYETTELRARLARHHGDNVDCAFWGWNRAWLDPGFKAWNIQEYLPSIRAPVMVIQGWQDEYGTESQVEAITRLVPAGAETVMLDKCGHSPHKDQPEATLAAIAGFVARIRPPAA
jgi:pimeloyl-ACP methyl ester carboxylesterase